MTEVGGRPELKVAKIIFVAPIQEGLGFTLVEYADGRLDVLRNGVPISPSPWPASEVANCVNTFQKVSRLAASAATGARPDHSARR